jgi:DNA-binding XRE family transcriptional regulator
MLAPDGHTPWPRVYICNYCGILCQFIFAYCYRVQFEFREAIQTQVARLLREARLGRELSLKQLAEKAGLSRQMVSYVEQEKRNPSLDVLLRISEVLQIKLEDLIRRARASARRRKQ